MKIQIPIVGNTFSDLSRLNFTNFGLKIINIRSNEFREYIRGLNPNRFTWFYEPVRNIISATNRTYDKRFAIINSQDTAQFDYPKLLNVFALILIMFPSDFQITNQLEYHINDPRGETFSTYEWPTRSIAKRYENHLYFHWRHIREINRFIRLVFPRIKSDGYVRIAINHYITSFNTDFYYQQFLTLCMVLETINDSHTELTYRLKRSTAILIGERPYNCRKIFDNVNKIYALRSKIVHGKRYTHAKIMEYLPMLRAICSRLIVELLVNNIKSDKSLGDKITELGYGQKSQICENYRIFKLNLEVYSKANWGNIT
jgi:hypothetical protein